MSGMRRTRSCALVSQIPHLSYPCFRRTLPSAFSSQSSFTPVTSTLGHHGDYPLYEDLPKPPTRKSERKPYPTPMKVLIRRAKEERQIRKAQPCRMLEHPPDNGLLVPDLVDLSHTVHLAWKSLQFGMSRLLEAIPIQRCRFCSEVHVGHVGHEIRSCRGAKSGFRSGTHDWRKGGVGDVVFFPKCYHLYDRVGKPRVGHDERHDVPRIPAILELCIQAGLDLQKYPCKRRTKPVYCIEGRIVDFESVNEEAKDGDLVDFETDVKGDGIGSLLWNMRSSPSVMDEEVDVDLRNMSMKTVESWLEMVWGTKRIMEKYRVQTCGYCGEVQVGPRGHKVRMCRASKHQSRNGLHAWQEARIEDVVGPNYVWHVRDLQGPALDNKMKRFYGRVPAVVELCVQAGAPIPNQYRSMMRLDVVSPERDEVDLVA